MKALARPKHKSSAGTESKESSSRDNYTSGKNRTYSDKSGQPGSKLDNSKLVGKQLPHDSAFGHVTGEALFVDDITPAKNELIVDFISSPVAHGKINNLNSMNWLSRMEL